MRVFNSIGADHVARRRWLFFGLTSAICLIAALLMASLLTGGGWTAIKVVIFILFLVLMAQVAYGVTLASFGYYILCHRPDPLRISQTIPNSDTRAPLSKTAIIIPIFNEDVGRVFQGVRVMYESLQRTGSADAFDFFILSDSTDSNHWIEEEKTWIELCKQTNAFGRIFYRNRRVKLNHKSGNVADFCRRWGADYRYMIVLDADSVMSGDVFVKLVSLMDCNPAAGIIQTAPQMVLGRSLYSRVQQFAACVYGPLFTAGANFWQLDGGNYWGHNAIVRLKPFMEYCALPELPRIGAFGGRILSHDTVEAAFMRSAGYEVWFAYDLDGSYEEGPPDLIAGLSRDRRWCQGNMQHILVLLTRKLRAANRFHLVIGILSYASAPLWLGFIVLNSIAALASNHHSPNAVKSGVLFAYVMALLLAPKVLGFMRVAKQPDLSNACSGCKKLLAGVMVETFFSMLLAPILMMFYTKFVAASVTGWHTKWGKQNRGEERPGWKAVAIVCGGQTLIAVIVAWLLHYYAPVLLPWLSPILAGLILSIPFSRLTSSVELGEKALRRGLFLIPPESKPPIELAEIDRRLVSQENQFFLQPAYASHYGLLQAILDPYIHAVHVSLLRLREDTNDGGRHYMETLSYRLLRDGPASLTPEERTILLRDAESMNSLHRELWICASRDLAEWWRQALRHYNETVAIATRRSVR